MTPKEIVKNYYPNAWAVESAQAGEWVIMAGIFPPKRLGTGKTPRAAWKISAQIVNFAEGMKTLMAERYPK